MKNDDNLSRQPHWRCRLCGHSTPLGEAVCSNPSCRADLGIYGEAVIPGREETERRSWSPREDDAQRQTEKDAQWEAEEQRRRENTQRQAEENRQQRENAKRQKTEDQRRRAEEKAQRKAARSDRQAGGGGDGGARSVLVKLAAGLAVVCALLSLVDIIVVGGWY